MVTFKEFIRRGVNKPKTTSIGAPVVTKAEAEAAPKSTGGTVIPSTTTTRTVVPTRTYTPTSGGGSSTPTPPPTDTTQVQKNIEVSATGVKTNNITYHGNTIVPKSGGRTANQLQTLALRKAQEVNPNLRRGDFKATFSQEERRETEQPKTKTKTEEVFDKLRTQVRKKQSTSKDTERVEPTLLKSDSKFAEGARSIVIPVQTTIGKAIKPILDFVEPITTPIKKGASFIDTLGGRVETPKQQIAKSGGVLITGLPPPILPAVSPFPKPVKVKFTGVSQNLKGGNVITNLAYKTSRGYKGTAEGVSKVIAKSGKVSISSTVTKGQLAKYGTTFPTGKHGFSSVKTFVSKGASASTPAKFTKVTYDGFNVGIVKNIKASAVATGGKVTVKSYSFKGITPKVKTSIFKSASIAEQSSRKTLGSFGITATTKGAAGSYGTITKISPDATTSLVGISGGRLQNVLPKLSLKAIQKTQEGVRSAVAALPQRTSSLVPLSSFAPSVSKLITTNYQKANQIPSVSLVTKQTSITKPTTSLASTTLSKSAFKQLQVFKTISGTTTRQPQAIIPNITTKITSGIGTTQATNLKTPTITKLTTRVPPAIRTPPVIPPVIPNRGTPFIPLRQPRTQIRGRRSNLFSVSIKQNGGFKTVRRGLSLGRALSFGALRTRRTAATTFKVAPIRGTPLPSGARTPKGFKRKKGTSLTFTEQSSIKLPQFKL